MKKRIGESVSQGRLHWRSVVNWGPRWLIPAVLAWSGSSAPIVRAGSISLDGWQTVVNNTVVFPGDTRTFNSYNQPSINDAGLVVFRGRSSGKPGGEPSSGIFTRDMSSAGQPLSVIATRAMLAPVPSPLPPGVTATNSKFNDFPAIPRIDRRSNTVVTRGQSGPTLEVPSPTPEDPTATTRVGTSGIYTNPSGPLAVGAAITGNLPGFGQFQVPGTTPGTKFDQFPGAPSVTDTSTVVFKGNWTDATGTPQTGVYWRDVANSANPVVKIADSNMNIPGSETRFGSTAPPSAAAGKAVFLGVNNEAQPTLGGIYMADLSPLPTLNSIVRIGDVAPGFAVNSDNTFTRLGEALSYDGRYVAFWGGVGSATNSLLLTCPEDGNADVLEYCMLGPDGLPGTGDEFDNYPVTVPTYQGIFVADTQDGSVDLVASTWGSDGFTDFVYWGFTGRPPGVGGGDDPEESLELARWRSTSFVAVDNGMVAFKGNKGDAFGLYLGSADAGSLLTIAEMGWEGSLIDPSAAGMGISALGIERDGFRNGRIAITASMANDLESMAGVYVVSTVPEPGTLTLVGMAVTALVFHSRRRRR